MNLKLIAPTVNRLYDPSLDTSISPREYGIFEYVALGVGLSVAAPCVTYILLKLATVAGGLDIPPIIIPLVPTIVGMLFLLLVFGIVIYSLHRRSKNQEKILEIRVLEAEAENTRAEAEKIRAEAERARATPPVIAEVIRPVPVMTSHVKPDAPEQPDNRAENKVEPVIGFYKDTKLRAEDLRWFIKESLKAGEHSRPYWIVRRKRAGTNIPPSGPENAINSQPIYEKYIQVLVDNKVIINRDNGETGEWMTRSYKKICLVLGIGDGSDWEPEPEKPDLT